MGVHLCGDQRLLSVFLCCSYFGCMPWHAWSLHNLGEVSLSFHLGSLPVESPPNPTAGFNYLTQLPKCHLRTLLWGLKANLSWCLWFFCSVQRGQALILLSGWRQGDSTALQSTFSPLLFLFKSQKLKNCHCLVFDLVRSLGKWLSNEELWMATLPGDPVSYPSTHIATNNCSL